MSEKKFGKRLLTWVLVIVMMLTVVPLNVLAKDGDKSNNTSSGNDKWSPKVEFWCTNATVNVGSYGISTNLSTLLSGKDSLYFANESSLQSGTIDLSSNDKGTGRFWKAVVQDTTNKQNGEADDNKTNVGTPITAIFRAWNGYKYLTNDGQEFYFTDNQTLILYYKQAFVSSDTHGVIYGTDWGYSGSRNDATLKVTYAIRMESTSVDLASGPYWYNKKAGSIAGIGALLDPKYEIVKVTVNGSERTRDANGEISLDRNITGNEYTVIFYIKNISKIKVAYSWVGAPNTVILPTDSNEYTLEATGKVEVSLVDAAKCYKSGTIISRDGTNYIFSGWFLNSGYTGAEITDKFNATGDQHTLYGIWTSPIIVVDLDKDDSNTARFRKVLTNADKLTENEYRDFTITVTNNADSNDIYTGTVRSGKNTSSADFRFNRKMIFDSTNVGSNTYTVREETNSS